MIILQFSLFHNLLTSISLPVCLPWITMQNAMISNIVHVSNIPRRTVIKWFEEKRAEEGVPEHRLPYQQSANETS